METGAEIFAGSVDRRTGWSVGRTAQIRAPARRRTARVGGGPSPFR